MTNIEQFFANLEREMELAYHDPYKWTLDIEIEDIPEIIKELKRDLKNLNDIQLKEFSKQITNSIQYKIECIQILEQRLEECENEQ